MPGAIDAMHEGVKKTERAPEQNDHGNYADAAPGHFEPVHCIPYEILLGLAERQEALYRVDDLFGTEERRSEGEQQGEKREKRKENVIRKRRGALLTINFNVDVRRSDDSAPRLVQSIADCYLNLPIGKRKSAGFLSSALSRSECPEQELEHYGKALLSGVLPLFAFLALFTAAAAASGKGGT